MVDARPLLFVNALALMLMVTAGFASIRQDASSIDAIAAEENAPVSTIADTSPPLANEPTPIETVNIASPHSEAVAHNLPELEPFSISPPPAPPKIVALAEPHTAMEPQTDTRPAPVAEKPEPTTATLVLRSNLRGDTVTINGRDYGATRLDLELDPGKYDITISKAGFKPWVRTIDMKAGQEMTLVGRLEAYTTVNFRNGTWIGGVKTGDGTYQNGEGLRYEGHFIDGEFHGQGTLTRANGDILTGEWSEGRLNGHGSLTTTDGMLYVGGFRDGKFHGRGSLTYPDGRHYEGEFSNGDFHGSGAEVFADGKKYEGGYINGKFHGQGLLRNPNGSSIEATFKHGEPYGQVRLTTAAGEVFTARTTEPGVCYRDKSYRATQCPQLEGW
ncbi:PEGA domain-containing protein [uncultured Marinobacter sp.]|uniref:PEGA domain-containing protein n=1 Tax=uncultured Marinobacter sp. TaxID=187379 RepID=UPI002604A7EE|nr:PEGA domain-containing protein [uncultured Marinobacter sp.]